MSTCVVSNSEMLELVYRAGWIDNRDNATAHILGLQKEAAAGERILLVYDHFKWQDFSASRFLSYRNTRSDKI